MHPFLSYGHDEHAALARRLKADLERHGHTVWFDEDRLKGVVEWERCLDDALDRVSAAPGKFLLVLTPHPTSRRAPAPGDSLWPPPSSPPRGFAWLSPRFRHAFAGHDAHVGH